MIDSNGIRPLPLKVAAIRFFILPTSKRQLQRFLGMVNFCRRFLPKCADTILLLTSILAGSKRTCELIPEALTSFEQVKALMADATLLTHFHADAPIALMIDASNVPVGAVLQQCLSDYTMLLAFFPGNYPGPKPATAHSDSPTSWQDGLAKSFYRGQGSHQPPAPPPAVYADTFCGSAHLLCLSVLFRGGLCDVLSRLSSM
nr:unnamed protein product [Spirometra erinaceieuropaei]